MTVATTSAPNARTTSSPPAAQRRNTDIAMHRLRTHQDRLQQRQQRDLLLSEIGDLPDDVESIVAALHERRLPADADTATSARVARKLVQAINYSGLWLDMLGLGLSFGCVRLLEREELMSKYADLTVCGVRIHPDGTYTPTEKLQDAIEQMRAAHEYALDDADDELQTAAR